MRSTGNIEICEQCQLDAHGSTNRQQHGKRPRSSRGPLARELAACGRMDHMIRSIAGQAIYALRKTIAITHNIRTLHTPARAAASGTGRR